MNHRQKKEHQARWFCDPVTFTEVQQCALHSVLLQHITAGHEAGFRSGNEVVKSKWKNPKQKRSFGWYLLEREQTASEMDAFLLWRAVPLVPDGAPWLGLHLPLLVSTSLVNTWSIQGFQIACVAPYPLLCDILTSSLCFPHATLFQGKVPLTLHPIIINFCMPQDLSPMFLCVVVQTGRAKSWMNLTHPCCLI